MIESRVGFSATGTQTALMKLGQTGLMIACCIIGLWATSLSVLLQLQVTDLPIWMVPLVVAWQGITPFAAA